MAPLSFILVLASPFLILGMTNRIDDRDWERLSYVGETYGAIAAVLAALSLLGVAASLLLQARQVRVQLAQGARANLIDLVGLALDRPDLAAGAPFGRTPDPAALYAGLWISHFATLYRLGASDSAEVQGEIASLFRNSPAARERWATSREAYRVSLPGRAGREYFEMVEKMFQAAQIEERARGDEMNDDKSARIEFLKSSYSGTDGCVEVSFTEGAVFLRNSRDPDGPVLRCSHDEWSSFLARICNEELAE